MGGDGRPEAPPPPRSFFQRRGGHAMAAEEASWRPPRACTDYWSEYKLCRSIRNLYHHYYTYGETPSCAQWKKDYKNCKEWERNQSAVAKEQLCNSERERMAKKEKHSPVWKLRKSPPSEWNSPIEEENFKR